MKIEYGSLYTSCVIVATFTCNELLDYKDFVFYNVVTAMVSLKLMVKHSLLVGTSRENVHSTPFLFP